MKLRVLIADDDALGRERLRHFLREQPQAELIAECTSGAEALEAIPRTSPHLVFLDIRMPEMDGFTLLDKFKAAPLPVVIFVTAYDRFAVRVFEVQAIDYLLKPFDRARFQVAFDRALARVKSMACGCAGADHHEAPPDRLAVKSQGRISLVNVAEVNWVSAADNYVELHLTKATHLLRTTLTELQVQLGHQPFVRISRSHLVNLERVKEIRSKSHGDAWIVLHDGTTLPATRIYARELRALMRNFT
jgi:two-component system, LytTR family, response regulator